MQSITLLNFPKVSTNKIYSGMHFSVRKKLKDEYLWFTLPFKTKLTPINTQVDLYFKFNFSKRGYDSSNCSFMAKMLEDCLVRYGILKDDTSKFVRRFTLESCKTKSKEDFVYIEIMPIRH